MLLRTDKRELTELTVSRQDDGRDPYSNLWDRPGFLVRRLHQIHISIFYEECNGENITPVQYGLLSILAKLDSIDQMGLAAELGVDRTNVGDVLRRLEGRGLISRVVNPADGRMRLVSITERGLAFLNRTRRSAHRSQERLLAPLPEKHRAQFLDFLRKLVEANNNLGRTALRSNFGESHVHANSAIGSSRRDKLKIVGKGRERARINATPVHKE